MKHRPICLFNIDKQALQLGQSENLVEKDIAVTTQTIDNACEDVAPGRTMGQVRDIQAGVIPVWLSGKFKPQKGGRLANYLAAG